MRVTPLLRGDEIADLGVGGVGEDVLGDEVAFVVEGTGGDNFVRLRTSDAREREELALGGGIDVDDRVVRVAPAFANALSGGVGLFGGDVGGFAQLSAGVFNNGLGFFRGFGDVVASFVQLGLLIVGGMERAAGEAQQE